MRLKVGLVGLGDQWNTRHRIALMALSDRFEVRAVCCEIAHKAETVAREFGAVSIDGFRAMVARDDIEAVMILAPDWVGPLPILAACEAGKAIYSSVAFDIAPEQIDDIRDRVTQSGVAFMAELPRRHAPATLRLKELMATRLGKPTQLFCHERLACEEQTSRRRKGKYCPLNWRHLMELIDWCCYLVDRDPSSLTSSISRPQLPLNDSFYQAVSLHFEATSQEMIPCSAQLSVGHYIPKRWKDALSYNRPASIQVCCENGIAFIDLPSKLVWFDDAGQHTESLEADFSEGEQLLIHFHRAVTSLVQKTSDLRDAVRAMRTVVRANDSSASGRRIDLFTE